MIVVQSGEPVGEVVSLALTKQALRVDHSDDDAALTQILASAIEYVQDVCGTVFLKTEFTAKGDDFCLAFTNYPNPEILTITYVDALGASGTITDFEVRDGVLIVSDVPEITSATVTFKAGLGAGNIPEKLIRAVLMQAAAFYDEGGVEIPSGVKAMTALHRTFAHG